jgi:hypothetical protein
MVAGKRIIGGFFTLMMGLGLILDSSWERTGALAAAVGAGLMLWAVVVRR